MKIARIVNILLLILLITCVKNTFASCTKNGYVSGTIYFGNVLVQRDAPVGSIIATASVTMPTGVNLLTCYSGNTYYLMNYKGGRVVYGFTNYYETGIGGVAISIVDSGGVYATNPASPVYQGTATVYSGRTYTATLKKVGDISSGTLSAEKILSAYLDSNSAIIYTDIYMGAGSVTQVACSITTPSLTFPIGDVLVSGFSSSVGTVPVGAQNTQNLGLNCDAGANINVMLQGTLNPDVSTTSVLALTGQGNADVAKGVGVQLLYNGAPLVLNNRIVLKRSAGGQETFPITARYYQTRTSVATGKANASATLDLTYQ
ncbi:fimbrial protein [Citrobacter telavivensis]